LIYSYNKTNEMH